MQLLTSNDAVLAALAKVLKDIEHPSFLAAYKMAAEFGFGKAAQPVEVEHSGAIDGKVDVTVTHRVIELAAKD